MKRNMIPFLMAMFNAENQQRYARIRQTGGHRARGYSVTQHDLDRIQAAAERRTRKAAKRHRDYLSGLANDPIVRIKQ